MYNASNFSNSAPAALCSTSTSKSFMIAIYIRMVQPQSAKLSSAPQKLTCESPESEKDVDVDVDVSCTWTWFLEHAHLDWQMHVAG